MRVKIVFLNIFFLLIGVLLLESLWGGWFLDKDHQINTLRNVSYIFDSSQLYHGGGNVLYRRDQYGLRGSYEELPRNADILTIGGSATDQRYIDEQETWQEVFEKGLKKRRINVDVVNAGVDGQSTYGNIKNFDLWFPKIPNFSPSYVLVYVGVNDLFADARMPNDDLTGSETWKGKIRSRSAFYHLYLTAKGYWQARFKFPLSHRPVHWEQVKWTDLPLQRDYRALFSGRFEAYEKRLKTLREKIISFGAKPIWVTQPAAFYKYSKKKVVGFEEEFSVDGVSVNGVDIYYLLSQINEFTMKFCHETGGICLDLANQLSFEKEVDFYDYFHNTPSGTEKIGRYLTSKLSPYLK